MANEFAHYGIPGMHWYIRRYQPYPKGYSGQGRPIGKAQAATATRNANAHSSNKGSSSKSNNSPAKLTAEEKLARKKQELLNSASPTKIYRNRKLFSAEELNNAWRRFEIEAKIRGEAEARTGKKLTSGKKKGKDYVGTGRKLLQGYANVVTDITKAYDATQKGKKLLNEWLGFNFTIKDPINKNDKGKKKPSSGSGGDSN